MAGTNEEWDQPTRLVLESRKHTIDHRLRPSARVDDLVVTAVRDETLVYDQERRQIHHLNPTMAVIWTRCDGDHSLADLAAATGVDVAAVADGIDQLAAAKLLLTPMPTRGLSNRHTRRRFLRSAAAGGIALPAIVSLSAPAAASTISQLDCVGPADANCLDLNNNERCCRDTSGCVGKCGDSTCNPYGPICIQP